MTSSELSERAILAQILNDPEWTRRNGNRISPVIFGSEQHRLIIDAVSDCGDSWDLLKVTAVLRNQGTLERAGGPSYVSELYMDLPIGGSAIEWHLEQVRTSAALRRVHATLGKSLEKLESAMQDGTQTARELLEQVKADIDQAGKLPGKRLDRVSMAEATSRVLDDIERRGMTPNTIPGYTTGFSRLDKLTLGMQPAHVWVFCGGPGDGKSTLMQNCAEGALEAGARLGIYQLEMPIEEQAFRFLASASMVDSRSLNMGMMTEQEAMALATATRKLRNAGAELIDTDDATASDIIADIEAASYDVVMVDYLQLMDEPQGRNESREMVVAKISRKLKKAAKKKGITILTGSQLNDDGKLRESRAIGQDADKVIRIARFVGKDKEEDDARRTLEILKNRGGPRNSSLQFRFQGDIFQFRELAE